MHVVGAVNQITIQLDQKPIKLIGLLLKQISIQVQRINYLGQKVFKKIIKSTK